MDASRDAGIDRAIAADGSIAATCPSLEGTCVVRFFDEVARCFAPAGMCTTSSAGGVTTRGWSSGAAWSTRGGDGTWSQSGRFCMGLTQAGSAVSEGFRLTPAASWPFLPAPPLRVDATTGDVVCPDGSTITIGSDYGGCAAIQRIVRPTCE